MYELTLFFYLVSFLYIAIVTSSWRAGCIESVFWFLINGLFMLYIVIRPSFPFTDYMIILSIGNTVRSTMLLLMGRGPKTEEMPTEEDDDFVMVEEQAPRQVPVRYTPEQDKENFEFDKKTVSIAMHQAAKSGYKVEDFSDKQIGYDLRISKDSTVYYILVKYKIEANGVIYITRKEYEKAKEFRTLYYLYAVLGGVEPWEEEIHIVNNPYGRLHFVFDSSMAQYGVDCDDIRIKSQESFAAKYPSS